MQQTSSQPPVTKLFLWLCGLMVIAAIGSRIPWKALTPWIATNDASESQLNTEELELFARNLTKAVAANDLDTCSRLFDTDGMIDRMLQGLRFHYAERDAVAERLKRDFRSRHAMYIAVVEIVANGGSFDIVNAFPNRDERHLLVRLVTPEGGLRYEYLTLERRAGKRLMVTNVETSGMGPLVESVATFFAYFAPYEGPDGKIAKEAPNAEAKIRDKTYIAGMQKCTEEGELRGVLWYYRRLSPAIQTERVPLLLALNATFQLLYAEDAPVSEDFRREWAEYLLAEYRRAHPKDKLTDDLATFTYLVSIEDYDGALKRLNRVDEHVGGDPFLDCLRAVVRLEQGNVEPASTLAERALTRLPHILFVRCAAAHVAIHRSDFDRAYEILEVGRTEHELPFDPNFYYALGEHEAMDFALADAWNDWLDEKLDPAGSED